MPRILPILFFAVVLAFGGFSTLSAEAQTQVSYSVAAKSEKTSSDANLSLGVYDPDKRFKKVKRRNKMAFEHVFIAWHSFDRVEFQERVSYAAKRGRAMMVTVEPWTKAPNWTDGGDELFSDILKGEYDEEITTVCTEISLIKDKPMVRWGHEMEEVTGRYPWARDDNTGYIAAFRYFVKNCSVIARKAQFVWSPIGHEPLPKYYPGKKYVDVIGIPIWGYQKADRMWYGHDRSFEEAVREKYERVTRYKKPVVIAELGVSGSRKYEKKWLSSFQDAGDAFPRLKAMVYYNRREPAEWPNGLGKPDWRVSPKMMRRYSNLF
jgi:beta-mannanase